MRISEILPADVGLWLPGAVDHMADVRVAGGSLRRSLVNDFKAKKTALFRVGVPRDSVVFVSDESDDWLWMRAGEKPELLGWKISGDASLWMEKAFEVSQGKPIAATFHTDDGIAGVPYRDLSVRLRAKIDELQLVRAYDDIHVRGMTSAELDYFLDVSFENSDRMLESVSDLPHMRETWDLLRRAKARLTDGVSTPGHMMLAVCVDTTVVGGIWVEVDGKNARIWNLFIYDQYRGHKHSEAAVIAMAEGLRSEGVKYLHTTVNAPGTRVIEIFLEIGFFVTAHHVVIVA